MAKKQAVVVIHGMGEQIPMGTLRELVRSVWEKDNDLQVRNGEDHRATAAHLADTGGRQPFDNSYWIKPDDRAGLQELRRITTGPLEGSKHEKNWPIKEGGRRTDFYEFYWADLMQGTTWQHIGSWVKGLLLRSPAQVPHDVMAIWILLWAGVLSGAAVLLTIPMKAGSFEVPWLWTWLTWLLAFVALVFFLLSLARLFARIPYWQTGLILGLLMLFVWLIASELQSLAAAGAIEAGVTMVAAYFLNGFLRDYFGDVARYVQATPANVERRKLIRERGLALLTGLHTSGEYDRIVVVSHSLGTIVAYDLINMLWSRIGPNHRNRSADVARPALEEMDKWLADVFEGKEVFAPDRFWHLQRAVSGSMAGLDCQPADDTGMVQIPWLISDFVTVGSPLTHAEFLLAQDGSGLDKLIEERILPVCPPVLEHHQDRDTGHVTRSLMYTRREDGKTYAHHACCFAAVRWINIYDKPPHPILFPFGDAISGSVIGNFGHGIRTVVPASETSTGKTRMEEMKFDRLNETWISGIREEKVHIRYGAARLPYFFTHSEYWQWQPEYETGVEFDHIEYLRSAIQLDEPPMVKRQKAKPAQKRKRRS